MTDRRVVIFGDSLLRPIIIDERNRYAVSKAVDFSYVERRLKVTIENHSRMGATIKQGYIRLLKYLAMEEEEISSAVIEFGGNDCDYDWIEISNGNIYPALPKTPPLEFEQTLNAMLDELTKRKIKPVLMTLPPISAYKYYDWIVRNGLNEQNIMKHLGDKEIIYRHQEFYSNMIERTAYKRNLDLLDIRSSFLLRNDFSRLLCTDGIHPNLLGQQIIMKAFIDKYEHSRRYQNPYRNIVFNQKQVKQVTNNPLHLTN